MTTSIIPAALSTKEVHEFLGKRGGPVLFEELLALYGDKHLRPLRTMSNGAQTWSTEVIMNVLRLAQHEGKLNDRPLVEEALVKWRAKNPPKKQELAEA